MSSIVERIMKMPGFEESGAGLWHSEKASHMTRLRLPLPQAFFALSYEQQIELLGYTLRAFLLRTVAYSATGHSDGNEKLGGTLTFLYSSERDGDG